MCGINGILYNTTVDKENVKADLTAMNDLIIHRGPDEDGVYTSTSNNQSIGMAMRRLSIIDLSSGQQPMYSKDESIVIVFNGEIYNFKILRSKLQEQGVVFNTNCDTEVVLKLYETEGVQGFKKLDGMYAFSILDKNLNKLFITRDFFGEKPLYYTKTNDRFIWASELKSILQVVNSNPSICKEGLALYFRLTYIPAPYTIYKDIYKLEPNSVLELDLDHSDFKVYNTEKLEIKKLDISFNQAKKEVKKRVAKSVESRSISDVPLGTFLSGGVDSSIVSLCLNNCSPKKIDTFSIGFEKASFDETDKSRLVAELINSNHHEFTISENDIRKNIDDILLNFDEPFADASSLATYLVSKKTRDHVTVALTGDGGDEVFGGYNKYYMGKLNRTYTKFVPKSIHNQFKNVAEALLSRKDDNRGKRYKLSKMLNSINYEEEYYWDIISLGFNTAEMNTIFNSSYYINNPFQHYKQLTGINGPKNLTEFRTIDRHVSLDGDMLVKVDRTSMLNSLECRAPFLNKDLFEFVSGLPEDYLLRKWNKKYILKEAFREEFPKGFLNKSKRGFGVPVGDWLRQGLRSTLESYIEPKFLREQGIFDPKGIIPMVKNHIQGKADNAFKIWAYFCFQKWYSCTYQNL